MLNPDRFASSEGEKHLARQQAVDRLGLPRGDLRQFLGHFRIAGRIGTQMLDIGGAAGIARLRRDLAVDLLQARSRAPGGKPNAFGSVAGTVHRRMEDIFVALGGGGKAVIQAIDRGEDYLREEFNRVLKDSAIDDDTQAVVRQAHASVAHGHMIVNGLKDQFATA